MAEVVGTRPMTTFARRFEVMERCEMVERCEMMEQ